MVEALTRTLDAACRAAPPLARRSVEAVARKAAAVGVAQPVSEAAAGKLPQWRGILRLMRMRRGSGEAGQRRAAMPDFDLQRAGETGGARGAGR
jgi:hypothetical protein